MNDINESIIRATALNMQEMFCREHGIEQVPVDEARARYLREMNEHKCYDLDAEGEGE